MKRCTKLLTIFVSVGGRKEFTWSIAVNVAKNLIAVFRIYFVVMVIMRGFVPFAVQELVSDGIASMSMKMRPQEIKEMESNFAQQPRHAMAKVPSS